MKTYKNYLKYIHSVIDKYDKFLRKYKISYLHLDISNSNIIIDDIILAVNSKYYELFYNEDSKDLSTEINHHIDMNVLNLLIEKQDFVLTLPFLLKKNMHSHVFIELLKIETKELENNINDYTYFEIYESDEDVKNFNKFNFQDLLFSKSKKLSLLFLEHVDSPYNQSGDENYQIFIDKQIEEKYSNIIEKYKKRKSSKKFNL